MNSRKDRQEAIKKLKTLVFTPRNNVEEFRQRMEKTYATVFLPNRVECKEMEFSALKCDFLIPELYSSKKIIFYVHGGSFVGGSRISHRSFCSSLANAARCRVVVPEFKLAPTHPFPHGLEDLQKIYTAIYTEEQISSDGKFPDIYLVADGSGASLAMALMYSLVGKFRESVKQIILFSPWLDLRHDYFPEKKVVKASKDEILTVEDLKMAGDVYTYAANLENPLVSPMAINEDKLKDLPPFFIQMGENEILLEGARKFRQILGKAGVKCDLDIWKNMPYCFQMVDEFLEESHLAIERIGKIFK